MNNTISNTILEENVSDLDSIKQLNNKNELKDKKINKRDVSIDLIRVIACIIVIATHLTLTTYNVYEVQVDWSRLFTKCFLADGVCLFFLITGFFISNGRNYKKILKKTFTGVIIPSFIVLLISNIFQKFIINQESLLYCIKNISINNFKKIAYCILTGDLSGIQVAAHLWYIFSYVQIMVLFPLIILLCNNNKESNLARRLLMILCTINIVLIDIQKFISFPIENFRILNIIDEKILAVLIGYELYCMKNIIKSKKIVGFVGLIIFILINILRYKAEMQYMILNHIVKEEAFITWNTSFGFISAICLFIAIYSLDIKNYTFSKIITYFSALTFGIYLIHYMIIAKIDIYKFEKISTFKFELLYMILATTLVFFISSIIIGTLKKIKKLIIKS